MEYTDSSRGEWYAWTRVLSADAVNDIARDLVLVGNDEGEAIITRLK